MSKKGARSRRSFSEEFKRDAVNLVDAASYLAEILKVDLQAAHRKLVRKF